MQVRIGATIVVENPSKAVSDWCKENLVLPNPDYAKKVRMHLWTGNTPKTLSLYEQMGNTLILPFGVLRDIQQYLQGCSCFSEFHDPVSVPFEGDVPLYPYQEDAVAAVKEFRYGILQSPAGSGKTQMGIALVMRYGRRALWLTHTTDLLNQSKARAERYMDKSLIGTITDGKVNVGAGITFATVQTMCRLDLAQYKDLWDVIIVDECHRCAGTPTAVTQFSKVLNSLSARHKYGLSATVHRSDGMIQATYALLGHVVYTVPDEAVKDKIMQVGIKPLGTGIKMTSYCLNPDGTLNYTKLINFLCDNPDRNDYIVNWIVAESAHPCLILSDRLCHLEAMMTRLPRSMREMSVMISGKMTTKKGKAEREQAIEDMRTGRKRYLFATYSLCKEGLDIPCLSRLFMTTPQSDYAVVVQSIGRVARICDGKSQPIVYDFVDDCSYAVKRYKQRLRHYRKAGAYLYEEPME